MTKNLLDDTWKVLEKSGVPINKEELERYVLSFNDEYSYKYAAIALSKDDVIGFALFTDLDDEVFLNHLYVCPLRRFKGVGTRLINHVQQYAGNRNITYIDMSNNFMPWMSTLPASTISNVAFALGSFYSR